MAKLDSEDLKRIQEMIEEASKRALETAPPTRVIEAVSVSVLKAHGVDTENPREQTRDFLYLRDKRLEANDTHRNVKRTVTQWTIVSILGALAGYIGMHIGKGGGQ